MFEVILPHSFVGLCAAFQSCFTVPTYRTFLWLVAGWLHCPGRRTLTGVAVASGALEHRHLSVFGRFFTRAPGSLDALGRVLFTLALARVPADQPLFLLVDDTLARWAVASSPLQRARFSVTDLAMLLGCWEDGDVDEVLAAAGVLAGPS